MSTPLHQRIIHDNQHQLTGRLKQKRDLLAADDPAHAAIKTALVIAGGGMRGAYAAGVVAGLAELGYGDVFDSVIGISAGAGVASYFVSGQTQSGGKIFEEDLSNKQFIRPFRREGAMDLGYLGHILHEVKPLDQQAVRASRSRLYIAVTEVASGRGVYLDIKDQPELDVVTAIMASSALPGLTNGPISIDGQLYSDGITGCATPMDFAINRLGATDILVIHNTPLKSARSLPMSERLLSRLTLRKFSHDFQQAHLTIPERYDFNKSTQHSDEVTIGVLCPHKTLLSRATRNQRLLASVAADAQSQTIEALTV